MPTTAISEVRGEDYPAQEFYDGGRIKERTEETEKKVNRLRLQRDMLYSEREANSTKGTPLHPWE